MAVSLPEQLARLNPEQRQAVYHQQGPLLVLAGAGSGKTRVIVHRIAYLCACGILPRHILGVTFTNKAAKEMQQRLAALMGQPSQQVTLCTFHALALLILKEEAHHLGLPTHFSVYDTSDQISVVRELLRQVQVADRRLDASRILQLMLDAKRQGLTEIPFDSGDDYEMAAYDLYPRYRQAMRSHHAVDFDDLLLLSVQILQIPQVAARWQQRFQYVMVDEYQDTSPEQLALIRLLLGPMKNICAVGDDDQAIYAWRGADIGNILSFGQHFPGTIEVVLAQNYRSTPTILAAANAVIAQNQQRKVKALWSAGQVGEPVQVVACADDQDEVTFVAETLQHWHLTGRPWQTMAVLYRANAQSRLFEEELRAQQIPYRLIGGQSYFDRKEIRDCLALLLLIQNPANEVALRRMINVPPRGIGPQTLDILQQFAQAHQLTLWQSLVAHQQLAEQLPAAARAGVLSFGACIGQAMIDLPPCPAHQLADRIEQLFEQLGLRQAIVDSEDPTKLKERRLANLTYFSQMIRRFTAQSKPDQPCLSALLGKLTLQEMRGEQEEQDVSAVTLMTLHSAKGLEFEGVCLVGLEEDYLPHKRVLDEGSSLDEERRLCYVGMTRAKQRLVLTYARERLRHGKAVPRTPSRFLSELPEEEDKVRWLDRDGPSTLSEQQQDALAKAFFEQMHAKLAEPPSSCTP